MSNNVPMPRMGHNGLTEPCTIAPREQTNERESIMVRGYDVENGDDCGEEEEADHSEIWAEFETARRNADEQYRSEMQPYNEARNERIEPYHQEYLDELRAAWADWRIEEKQIAAKRHEIMVRAEAKRDGALKGLKP